MERSVLEMLYDRSSALILLGCRPSARKSLGCSQKIFQFHSFKANILLNLSCPRRYVGRGPDTMIVVAGDVLRTVSIRLLKSLFSVSVCHSLVSLTPAWITTAATLSSSFRIAGICTETSRIRASGKQWVCTLPGLLSLRWSQRKVLSRREERSGYRRRSRRPEEEKSSTRAWIASSAAGPRILGFPALE